MASGAAVVHVMAVQPPITNFAILMTRAGGSTPSERAPVWAFDASADTYLDFYCHLVGYAGGGLTFTLDTAAATAVTGGSLMALAIRALVDDADDVDVSHTYDYNEVRVVCASASGEVVYDTITFTNGADMDNLVNGQAFILRVRRRGSDNTATTGDDMAGFLQLLGLVGIET